MKQSFLVTEIYFSIYKDSCGHRIFKIKRCIQIVGVLIMFCLMVGGCFLGTLSTIQSNRSQLVE